MLKSHNNEFMAGFITYWPNIIYVEQKYHNVIHHFSKSA